MLRLLLLTAVLLQLLSIGAVADEPLRLAERWVYCPTNLLVKENVDKLEQLFRRAQASGYTHVNLVDSKFGHLGDLLPRYFEHVKRVQALGKQYQLVLIPGVFPIGWSNDLLYNDPDLAEGLPVRDALFVVQRGEARLQADPPLKFRGGDMSDFKQWDWHDPSVTNDQGAARLKDLNGGIARLVQSIELKPFHQYHVSARIKTQDFVGGVPEIKILAGEQQLNYNDLGVKPTQDWTVHHTVFNSLENSKVGLYLGCWGGRSGSLWYDDVVVEEVGLLNVLRRPGAPLVVRREGADAPLVEGTDFEPVADPLLGHVQWPGDYNTWHEPPRIKTRLDDGTRLRVSYYHPLVIYGGSVMIALSEPKTLDLLRDQARRMHELWQAPGYFMQHDEIRLCNWDAASVARKLDAGPLLADNVRQCIRFLDQVNPGGKIYVWSDMFDPHHNAHDKYYLVRGNLAGSWEGLDPKVIIMNWNHDHAAESLKFFKDRGHRNIIAGYYDAPVGELATWIAAARQTGGVDGVMYTTWQNNYDQLEAFAKAADGK